MRRVWNVIVARIEWIVLNAGLGLAVMVVARQLRKRFERSSSR